MPHVGDEAVNICDEGGKGIVLPLTERELELPNGFRGFIYGAVMVYFFLGVSIIADTFMGAIEVVTSRRRQVRLKSGRFVTLRVWNDTVANLTLMALGSSAPEILLSVIELFKTDMFAGELGPFAIVGSAAFNLLIIVAICIVVIPDNETRKVKELGVFNITLVFSLFAYIWIVVILGLITPDVVDIWEALVTFMCFPLLVWVSWLVDRGTFGAVMRPRQTAVCWEDGHSDEAISRLCEILGSTSEETQNAVRASLASRRSLFDPEQQANGEFKAIDVDRLRQLVDEHREPRGKTRATRRIEATRVFTGAWKGSTWRRSITDSASVSLESGPPEVDARVEFACDSQPMSCELFLKKVLVLRRGRTRCDLVVEYCVYPLMADLHGDGETSDLLSGAVADKFTMTMDEQVKEVTVRRPAVAGGRKGDFMVQLQRALVKDSSEEAGLGSIRATQVSVSQMPHLSGKIAFSAERVRMPGKPERLLVQLLVQRKGGCSGDVSCSYHTERLSAVPGFDYTEARGEVKFAEGQTEQFIDLEILPRARHKSKSEFLVVLSNAEGGASFDCADDGGSEASILTVEILPREDMDWVTAHSSLKVLQTVDRYINLDLLRQGNQDCLEQFVGAIYCNGGPEEQRDATWMDWVFHLTALPWKLLFTVVPPPSMCGGWICFFVSLGLIGVVTAIIGDLAELFGCVLDVPDAVTAIVFVALGTSMPDLFASQTAAVQDPTADASIVNVTGSNSVNVFLGLGLPWTIGAVYWRLREDSSVWEHRFPDIAAARGNAPAFIVFSDNLAFSVLVFICSAGAAFLILNVRRRVLGGELGGPRHLKFASAISMVITWGCFVMLSSWQVMRSGKASAVEWWAMVAPCSGCCVLCLAATLAMICQHGRRARTRKGHEGQHEGRSREVSEDLPSVPEHDMLAADVLAGDCPTPFSSAPESAGHSLVTLLDDSKAPENGPKACDDSEGGPTLLTQPHAAPAPASPNRHSAPVLQTAAGQLAAPAPPPILQWPVEDACDDGLAPPVHPLATPSVPPLLFTNDQHGQRTGPQAPWDNIFRSRTADGAPVAKLPNPTQDATLIGQHEALSRSPTPRRSDPMPLSSPSRFTL